MKPTEADSLIDYLFGAFNRQPNVPQREAWSSVLLELDAQIAMRVAMWFQRNVEHMPTAASFLTAYRSELDRGRPGQAKRVKCEVCLDDGQVFVGTNEMGTDQAAPCPNCEKGRNLEFQWYGQDGFWQGRQWKRVDSPQTVEEILV